MAEYYKRVIIEEPKLLRHQADTEDTPDVYVRYEPAADVVEVVRCKDCKHWDGLYSCDCHKADENGTPIFMRESDFCSYGERRSE